MDMLHVDIILLVILCFLTVFMCAYGVYCVYRVLVSIQTQVLLRPTRVLFSHKKEGQSREELRTVVAYQNPFTGDYCVHKSRDGARGYLNTAQSPDSGLSDEYEPLRQPALPRTTVEPHQIEPEYTQRVGQASTHALQVEPSYTQSLQPSYTQNVESAYGQQEPSNTQTVEPPYKQIQPSYTQNVEPSYKQIQPSYTQNVEPPYKQIQPSYTQNVESAYKQIDAAYRPTLKPEYQRREDFRMSNEEPGYQRHLESRVMVRTYHHEKSSLMTSIPGFRAGVEPTSTQSLNTAQSLKYGWFTHLKSALRKSHRPLKASSMPSVEDNIIDKTWNWNYKEYQI